MKPIISTLFAFVSTLFRSRLTLQLENVALRHQLSVYQRGTLQHLLNHSSGLIDHVFDAASGFANVLREQFDPAHATDALESRELVRFALDQKPMFRAGEGYHYAETGYILAGMIIEKAGGSTYYEELDRRLLQPLGLMQTSVMNRRKFAGLVSGYAPKARELLGSPV